MVVKLSDTFTISVGDTELVSVDFTQHLDEGELLTGTPTAVSPSVDLTTANLQLNTVSYLGADGVTVPIGHAVQFSVTSIVAATYTIPVVVSTDATIARTFVRAIDLTFA